MMVKTLLPFWGSKPQVGSPLGGEEKGAQVFPDVHPLHPTPRMGCRSL